MDLSTAVFVVTQWLLIVALVLVWLQGVDN